MKIKVYLLFILILLQTGGVFAEKSDIAVLRITSSVLSTKDLDILNNNIPEIFKRIRMPDVLIGERIIKLLGEEYVTNLEYCAEAYCFIEAGEKLGVLEVVSGSIELKDNDYIATIRRYDVKKGAELSAYSESCNKYPDLLACIESAYKKIFDYKPMGTLTVFSVPPSAEVMISGKKEGETPFEKMLLTGDYTLILKKSGYYDEKREIKIEENKSTEIFVSMEPFTNSKISVETDPPGAGVFINNRKSGITPYTERNLRSGTYEIKIEKENYETITKKVEIGSGTDIKIKEVLRYSKRYLDSIRLSQKRHKILGYAGIGLTTLSFASGIYFKLLADEAYKNYRKSFKQDEIERYRREIHTNIQYMNVSIGVGAAFAIGSAISFLTTPDMPEDNVRRISVLPLTDGAGLYAEFRF